jgi:hypothetical protein
VADADTMTTTSPTTSPRGDDVEVTDGRSVRRARTLPGGRAVVGALLVAAAAVGVFAAYLNATAEPSTRYLVARATVEPGTRITGIPTIAELFEARAIDLDPDLAAQAVRLEDAESIVGRLVLAPLAPGELLSRSALVADGGVADANKISFAIDRADALAGDLRVGERIDVLATYGSGDNAYTAYVVRGVPLVARSGDPGSGGLGGGGSSGGPLTLTVAITAPEDVQALAHAVATADIVVTRSTVLEGDRGAAPPPYTASPDAPGPSPDPAGDPVGEPDAPAPVDGDDDGEDAGPTAPAPDEPGDGEPEDEDAG